MRKKGSCLQREKNKTRLALLDAFPLKCVNVPFSVAQDTGGMIYLHDDDMAMYVNMPCERHHQLCTTTYMTTSSDPVCMRRVHCTRREEVVDHMRRATRKETCAGAWRLGGGSVHRSLPPLSGSHTLQAGCCKIPHYTDICPRPFRPFGLKLVPPVFLDTKGGAEEQ